jgi:putative membrane protein
MKKITPFKLSFSELSQLMKNRFVRISFVAVALIPLLYGFFYLWAFWDPYSHLKDLPVAVVNNDLGYVKDGNTVNFGNELTDKIKASTVLKWSFVSEKDADNGLKNRNYYISIIIPSNFSEDIMSVNGDNPKQAEVQFKAREATNLLSSQIVNRVASEMVYQLSHEITSKYVKQMVGKISSGSQSLSTGLSDVNIGSQKLLSGSIELNNGLSSLSQGLSQVDGQSPKLAQGSSQVYNGIVELEKTINDNSTTTKGGIDQISNLLLKINQGNLSSADKATLITAIGGLKKMSTNIDQSLDNNSEGSKKMLILASGAKQVSDGSLVMNDALNKIYPASQTLYIGSSNLNKGIKTLNSGLLKLSDGSETMSQEINKENSGSVYDIISSPVVLKDVSIDKVPNYGTGFSPYFIPLALWVGALILFLIIKVNAVAIEGVSKKSVVLSKFITLSLLGTIQAIILDTVLITFLGLAVKNVLLFYVFTILMSWCFIAMIQLLVTCLDEAGKFLAIVLLMLQLTSSAGTFPLELVPQFFQKINPFLPMTYAVTGLREVISGGNWAIFGTQVIVISIFLILSLGLTIISTKHIYKIKEENLFQSDLNNNIEEV